MAGLEFEAKEDDNPRYIDSDRQLGWSKCTLLSRREPSISEHMIGMNKTVGLFTQYCCEMDMYAKAKGTLLCVHIISVGPRVTLLLYNQRVVATAWFLLFLSVLTTIENAATGDYLTASPSSPKLVAPRFGESFVTFPSHNTICMQIVAHCLEISPDDNLKTSEMHLALP